MESRNPVFTRSREFSPRGYATSDTRTPTAHELQDMYSAPAATTTQMGRMTIDDVVMRAAAMFAVLLITASATYFVWKPTTALPVLGTALVGFVLAMVISFSRTIRPPLMLAYAAVEGVFVGGISYWYDLLRGHGIVAQAVLGTLAAFAAMLVLYRTGVLKATPKFRRVLMIAIVGYLVFGLLNFVLAAFHIGGWQSVYSQGGLLAVAISGFGVVLASLFLVLDFDFIDQGVRNGVPVRFAWMAAFGLVVTLVWLYLEMLRLLAILRGNN